MFKGSVGSVYRLPILALIIGSLWLIGSSSPRCPSNCLIYFIECKKKNDHRVHSLYSKEVGNEKRFFCFYYFLFQIPPHKNSGFQPLSLVLAATNAFKRFSLNEINYLYFLLPLLSLASRTQNAKSSNKQIEKSIASTKKN